jgi:hypothetical protein
MSNVEVPVRSLFVIISQADEYNENSGWAGPLRNDRRIGQRIDQGYRRLRPCGKR